MYKLLRHYCLFVFCLIPYTSQAQMAAIFEFGTGFQGDEWMNYDAGIAFGYSVIKGESLNNGVSSTGFVGVKVQKFPIVSPASLRKEEDKFNGLTTDLWNFPVFVGLRSAFNLFEVKKGTGSYIGVFPECRLYFSPFLPRKIDYLEHQEYPEPDIVRSIKGKRMSQWATGFGGGIYYGNLNRAFLALKFETNSIDSFESIRSLDYKKDVFGSRSRQFIISLSLYGII